MIPAGKYRAKKIGGDLGFTSKGADEVAILFKLVETGEEMTWFGFFTEKTEKNTLKTLAILGVLPDFSNINDPNDKEVTLVVEHEADDKGVIQAKVRWVNDGDGLMLSKRMDPAQRATFVKKYGAGLAMAAGPKATGAAATQARPATQPANGQKPLPASQRGDAYDGPEPPADYPF